MPASPIAPAPIVRKQTNAYATPPTRWLAESTRENNTVVHPDEKVVYEAIAWMNKVGRVLQ